MNSLSTKRRQKRFPKRCCVVGCKTKARNESELKNRLFRFVQWPKLYLPESRKELDKKRYWLWITVLGQHPRHAEALWVCHEHFVTGRPAAPSHEWESDWVPNQNLDNRVRINDENSNLHPVSCLASESEICHPPGEPDLEGPFCRFCLKKNVIMRPLYPSPRIEENHLIRIVEEVASIRMEFAADYNSFVCNACQQRMEEFFGYRKMWQANDLLLTAFREKESFVEPTPIVAIPIEQLMEYSSEETIPCSHDNYEQSEQNPDTIVKQDYQEDEYLVQNVSIDPEDTKPPYEEITIMETTLISDTSFVAPSVKEEPPEDPEISSAESREKDRLIRKLMKKVRRETLSPKKRKSTDSSSRNKKHKSKRVSTDRTDTNKNED